MLLEMALCKSCCTAKTGDLEVDVSFYSISLKIVLNEIALDSKGPKESEKSPPEKSPPEKSPPKTFT